MKLEHYNKAPRTSYWDRDSGQLIRIVVYPSASAQVEAEIVRRVNGWEELEYELTSAEERIAELVAALKTATRFINLHVNYNDKIERQTHRLVLDALARAEGGAE